MQVLVKAINALDEVLESKDDLKLKLCGINRKPISNFMFDEQFAVIDCARKFLCWYVSKLKD